RRASPVGRPSPRRRRWRPAPATGTRGGPPPGLPLRWRDRPRPGCDRRSRRRRPVLRPAIGPRRPPVSPGLQGPEPEGQLVVDFPDPDLPPAEVHGHPGLPAVAALLPERVVGPVAGGTTRVVVVPVHRGE